MKARESRIARREFLLAGAAAGVTLGLGWRASAAAAPVLKVGMALVSAAAELGWTHQHQLGAEAIRAALGGQVEVSIVDNIYDSQDAERVFRSFAASGHRLVFGTSFSHTVPIARVAQQFPAVAFDCCSGVRTTLNLGGFEARYHEGAYLAGVAAARVSKSARLGFIGGFPVPDVVGPANAFLLGARSVNPRVTCTVIFMNSWEDPGKEKEATLALIAQGCDVLAAMTDSPVAAQTADQKGVWSVGYASDLRKYAPKRLLSSMILDWNSIYIQDARDVLAGSWKPQARWWGLKEGVVKMGPWSEQLDADTRALLDRTDQGIRNGGIQPFGGEIRDQDGAVRVRAGTVLGEQETRSINWLVAGMQGRMKG